MSHSNSTNASGASRRPSLDWEPEAASSNSEFPRYYGPEITRLLVGLNNGDPEVLEELHNRYDPANNKPSAAA